LKSLSRLIGYSASALNSLTCLLPRLLVSANTARSRLLSREPCCCRRVTKTGGSLRRTYTRT
tara:strand:- start:287 stop:472 length:186 start_codon:yes stop_codon:yes gene_type:complete